MVKKKFDIGPYLYLLPALVIIIVFRLVPILFAFVLSFREWSINGAGAFIGFENYKKLLADPIFWQSMLNTFYLVIFVVPLSLFLSLVFANFLNSITKLRAFFRTVYYIPTVTSMVAVSIVWKMMYSKETGLMNYLLGLIGIDPLGWLGESKGIFQLMFGEALPAWAGGPSLALFSIIILTVWKGLGYNTIIYLAGLQNIPETYYEAASLDGANKFTKFFKITLPLVSPTTFYVLMMTTITTFQVFSQIYLMTGPGPTTGGPLGTTKVIVYYLFEQGYDNNNYGYASAIALVLFFTILSLTLFQRRLEKKVHY